MAAEIRVVPIGVVRNAVREALDDIWGGVRSRVELELRFGAEALAGIEEFSHVEIVFAFDRVGDDEIEYGARHPRGRKDWPRVGIFAQRAKIRPNRIGVTVCRLVGAGAGWIEVEGLDAVDGTPVLDIKPYIREFAPRGEIRQPQWASELMAGYWGS